MIRYDNIAHLSGIIHPSFAATYPDLVKSLSRAMYTYTMAVRQSRAVLEISQIPGSETPQVRVEIDANGYPILPLDLVTQVSIKIEWERIFAQYLTQHYGKWSYR